MVASKKKLSRRKFLGIISLAPIGIFLAKLGIKAKEPRVFHAQQATLWIDGKKMDFHDGFQQAPEIVGETYNITLKKKTLPVRIYPDYENMDAWWEIGDCNLEYNSDGDEEVLTFSRADQEE